VESCELQAAGGELLEVRRLTRAAECRRGAEAGIVDQDDEYIRRSGRRTDRPDRRILRVRVFRVKRRQADRGDVWNWQHAALDLIFRLGHRVLCCARPSPRPPGARALPRHRRRRHEMSWRHTLRTRELLEKSRPSVRTVRT
jgi:hypothetical protein